MHEWPASPTLASTASGIRRTRLIEPLGLLSGPAAGAALAAGLAVPLRGRAFALARLIDETTGPVIRAADIPPDWRAEALALAALPPPWAGLTWAGFTWSGLASSGLAGQLPAVMGILNVTPDSFSDGGLHAGPGSAIAAGLAMAADGADIVDIGGESTRPGAAAITPEEEQARVVPVIRALAGAGIRVSVDTRNASTMAAALDAGAVIVNDVSALTHDPAALRLVAARGACVVLMHMRGEPATMHSMARYDDVTVDVTRELFDRAEAARAAGISEQNIVIDPGIGFAKTAGQNLELLHRLPVLLNLGYPILVGSSRKSFIGKISGVEDPIKRLPGSLAAALYAAGQGASILRVHDVAGTLQALRVCSAMLDP